jgi:multidrug efflux system outer membrane protein
MGPNFKRPETATPPRWRDPTQSSRDSSYANLRWWDVLRDTTLQRLVRNALEYNTDLYIAVARVNQARAQLGIQRIESYPQIDVRSSARVSNGSDSLLSGQGTRTLYFIEGEISWEMDFWGRLRRLNESALAALLATEEDRRAVIITVVGDVARAYLEMRDLDAQASIAAAQVRVRQRSLEIARFRFQGGLTSELDVQQGELALAAAQGTEFRVLRERTQKENELSILLGRPPEAMPRGLSLTEQRFDDIIPAGLPSRLLQRRPDIRAAEERVHAANARVGAAIAALFPTISLTGSLGTASPQLSDLFKVGTGFTRVALGLFQPVIDVGRNQHQVELERARTEEAVGQYERTVLTALREVEDGLVAIHRLYAEVGAATRASEAARRTLFLANLRYEGGVDNYLQVLDAQREVLDAELNESQLRREHQVAVVQLYRALGGGWDPTTDLMAMPNSVNPSVPPP